MKHKKGSRSPQASPSTPTPSPTPSPTREQIAGLAYAIWLDRGKPEGMDLDTWLEAERQLRGEEPRRPLAADDIPADNSALDPERALEGGVERELNRVTSPPRPRSPTSL